MPTRPCGSPSGRRAPISIASGSLRTRQWLPERRELLSLPLRAVSRPVADAAQRCSRQCVRLRSPCSASARGSSPSVHPSPLRPAPVLAPDRPVASIRIRPFAGSGRCAWRRGPARAFRASHATVAGARRQVGRRLRRRRRLCASRRPWRAARPHGVTSRCRRTSAGRRLVGRRGPVGSIRRAAARRPPLAPDAVRIPCRSVDRTRWTSRFATRLPGGRRARRRLGPVGRSAVRTAAPAGIVGHASAPRARCRRDGLARGRWRRHPPGRPPPTRERGTAVAREAHADRGRSRRSRADAAALPAPAAHQRHHARSTTPTRPGSAPASTRCSRRPIRTGSCAWSTMRRRRPRPSRTLDEYAARDPRIKSCGCRRTATSRRRPTPRSTWRPASSSRCSTTTTSSRPTRCSSVARFINGQPDVDFIYTDEDKLDMAGARVRSVLQAGLVARALPVLHVHEPPDGAAAIARRAASGASGSGTKARRTTTSPCVIVARTSHRPPPEGALPLAEDSGIRPPPRWRPNRGRSRPRAARSRRTCATRPRRGRRGRRGDRAVPRAASRSRIAARHARDHDRRSPRTVNGRGRPAAQPRPQHPAEDDVSELRDPGRGQRHAVGRRRWRSARHAASPRVVSDRGHVQLRAQAQLLAYATRRVEHLVILNDDVEVISSEWLKALLEYAQDEAIGAVGAKLSIPDGRLQHTGIVLGVCGVAAHVFHRRRASRPATSDRRWGRATTRRSRARA